VRFEVDRLAPGRVSSGNFRFPVPVIILPMLHTHLSIGGWYKGPSEATVPKDSISSHICRQKEPAHFLICLQNEDFDVLHHTDEQ
jgi:hypothetical protein